jgi:hypothetical protein
LTIRVSRFASRGQWLAIPVFAALVSPFAGAMALAQNPSAEQVPASDPAAEEFMVRAHQARANWDNMPGFTAKVTVAEDGRQIEGEFSITEDGEIMLRIPNEFREWAQTRLDSLFLHRQSRTGGFNVTFADDQTEHPLGRLIRINDDQAMGSQYRIQDDLIREVHRNMGATRFTITITDVYRNSDNKYLPRSYSLAYWDAVSGDLTSSMTAHDEWIRVERWDLPLRLLSIESDDEGKRRVREIRFENHQLTTGDQTAGE